MQSGFSQKDCSSTYAESLAVNPPQSGSTGENQCFKKCWNTAHHHKINHRIKWRNAWSSQIDRTALHCHMKKEILWCQFSEAFPIFTSFNLQLHQTKTSDLPAKGHACQWKPMLSHWGCHCLYCKTEVQWLCITPSTTLRFRYSWLFEITGIRYTSVSEARATVLGASASVRRRKIISWRLHWTQLEGMPTKVNAVYLRGCIR